ncbi:sugar ABC transporter substrate-binding protein [Arthrobacter ramosus]|uniref:Sugar ABC transporter substrate-binding protein n=1 Tax=Arthrobacter ramosus TaxID=1672 RepID=A0ABV5Y4Q6_ARTRM|nr:sugar ABC transporter substrate-binding protein [Arthrobacter ramosus]
MQHKLDWQASATSAQRARSRALLSILGVAAALALAACGNGSGSGQAASDSKRIAVFQPTNTNNYTVTEIKGAVDAAKSNGYEVDVFDSEFDAAKQASQVQQATDAKRYDGFVIMASGAPGTVCTQIQNAMRAGIRVAMINQPACDPAYGQNEYANPMKGTSFTGWQSPKLFQEYFEAAFKANPEGGEYAVIAPPAAHQNFGRVKAALDAVAAKHPQWTSVGFVPGDYLTNTALAKTAGVIAAHPNLKLLFSLYSGMTDGAYAALSSAGHADTVKIIDWVSEVQGYARIKSGVYQIGFTGLPYEEGYRGTQSVIAQITGKDEFQGVPAFGFIDLSKDPKVAKLGFEVKATNVEQFQNAGFPELPDQPATLKVANPF